jgi:hypothetical protein
MVDMLMALPFRGEGYELYKAPTACVQGKAQTAAHRCCTDFLPQQRIRIENRSSSKPGAMAQCYPVASTLA